MCVCLSSASAAPRMVRLGGNFDGLQGLFSDGPRVQSADRYEKLAEPVRIHGRIAGTGRFKGMLGVRRNFAEASNPALVLLQGSGQVMIGKRAENIPVFATGIKEAGANSRLRLFLLTAANRRRLSNDLRLQELKVKLTDISGGLRVVHVRRQRSARHMHDGFCGVFRPVEAASLKTSSSHAQLINPLSLQTATLLIEADSEYATDVGNLSEELSTVVNGIDALYQRDLGVAFEPTIDTAPQSYVRQISYSEDYSIPLHQEMREHRPASSRGTDMHFLMTGKRGMGELRDVAGAVPGPDDPYDSEIGVLCRQPENAIGFAVRIYTSEDILTTAHEIGHILGAEHDDNHAPAGEPGIMNSGTGEIDGEITKFSQYSKNQIAAYLSNYGNCSGAGGGSGDPSGGGYSVYLEIWQLRPRLIRPRVQIKGEIWDSDDYWVARKTVTLTCTDQYQQVAYQAVKRSTRRGKYNFRVWRPEPEAGPITCQASSESGAVSNALTIQAM